MPRQKKPADAIDSKLIKKLEKATSAGEESGRPYFRYAVRPSGRYVITYRHVDNTVDIQAVDEHGNDLNEWHDRVSKDSLSAV